MITTLIISPNKTKRENYALQICREQHIDPFDITIIASEQALGITDVRSAQKKIFLKPLRSEQKAIIIENAHKATQEAQNALLKVIEEPPAHTVIILPAATENTFLPTILSRCKIILLDKSSAVLSEEDQTKYTSMMVSLQQATVSEKLTLAQDMAKEKENAIEWLEKMIKAARIILLEKINNGEKINNYIPFLESLQKAHITLNGTNVNARFLLEHTLLNFSLFS